jgi:predicted TIM-barrel fold metal-dependent hydrolase
LRPLEEKGPVTDPYFDPILEAAQDLDMAMAIHIANGNATNVGLWRTGSLGGLASFRTPTILACASALMGPVHDRFPRLRWGFIEASASWMPWLDSEVAQRTGSRVRGEAHDNIFAEKNIYVTCQNEDDIPYLIQRGFLDSLVIGTDFGHFDASSDVDAITKFQDNPKLTAEQKKKVLHDNPKTLYSL